MRNSIKKNLISRLFALALFSLPCLPNHVLAVQPLAGDYTGGHSGGFGGGDEEGFASQGNAQNNTNQNNTQNNGQSNGVDGENQGGYVNNRASQDQKQAYFNACSQGACSHAHRNATITPNRGSNNGQYQGYTQPGDGY